MSEHYSARRFWRQVYEHKADFTDTMSLMNRTLLMQPVQPWEKEHSLKQIYFSMGLSDQEKEAFEKRFNVRLLNSYGMTETVSAVTCEHGIRGKESLRDLAFVQSYFRAQRREPTYTELKVIDTYWSDHCRHTTFTTALKNQNQVGQSAYRKGVRRVYRAVQLYI